MTAPKPQPERTKIRQDTLRKLAKRAVKAAGIDIPSIKLVDEIAKLVTLQCEEVRERHVWMLRECVGRDVTREETGDVLLTRLAEILESYWVDANGDVRMPEEMP